MNTDKTVCVLSHRGEAWIQQFNDWLSQLGMEPIGIPAQAHFLFVDEEYGPGMHLVREVKHEGQVVLVMRAAGKDNPEEVADAGFPVHLPDSFEDLKHTFEFMQ